MTTNASLTPNPPFGYSTVCELPPERQMELVAQFHAYRIRPTRMAYRLGIDIAFIDGLLAGEIEPTRFKRMVSHYRKAHYRERLQAADRIRGSAAYELRQKAQAVIATEMDI